MEDHNLYEIVGSLKQGARYVKRGYSDSKMYMVPNAAQYDEDNEYEDLQISTAPSKKQSVSERGKCGCQSAGTGTDNQVRILKKKRGCIVICILLTALAVITLVALAVGALSLRGSLKADELLQDEMRSLKSQLVQLHSDTQRNISRLMSQLSNQGQQITSVSCSLTSRLSATHSRITISITQLSSSAYQVSTSVSRVSTSVSRLSTSAYSLSTSAFWHSYSASRLSFSASRLSTSVYSLSTSVAFYH